VAESGSAEGVGAVRNDGDRHNAAPRSGVDHPIPRPTQANNLDHANAVSVLLLGIAVAATWPASVAGALVAKATWRITDPPIVGRWLVAGLGAVAALMDQGSLAPAWPWQLALHAVAPAMTAPTVGAITHALVPEALLGPALLLVIQYANRAWSRTIAGQEWARYRAMTERKRALEWGWPGPAKSGPAENETTPVPHPPGAIRLGAVASTRQPFDLGIAEVEQHIFLPGASGTGKTTTIGRLTDGALANGMGVVIIDCKGTGLGGPARALAVRHGVPLTVVDPHDEESVGYDPCSGEPAAVANKIVGAFSFSGEAEIYKQVAMEAVPVICRALAASGQPITLEAIYGSLAKGGLSRLGRAPGAEGHRDRLQQLEDSGGVGTAGFVGLQRRLGALMEGTFGDLFRQRPALSWPDELSAPRVTYISLSATGASEDVELFGRVVLQDLKQVADSRMRAMNRGDSPQPVMIVIDEFAALREATQVVDLLLQARQAKMPLVVATQYLPELVAIRQPVLSTGVLIAHRLESKDAELVAAQFGTHTTMALTAQVDYETGTSEKGSVRQVEEYHVHPNDLRSLPVGVAAVLSRVTARRNIVRVQRTV